jgi:DNA-binding IclR family transcriptional regulator
MKSLHKVLDLIETMAGMGDAGIRELSAATGFPPATIHRMVATLVQRGYLKQDRVTKAYALSLRFLELGTRVREQFNLVSLARPHLEGLMADTKEAVNLAVRDGDDAVYLDHVASSYSMIRLFTKVGARVPLYATGVGKAFLSREGEAELEDYFQRTQRMRHAPHTLVGREALREGVERVRRQGYAVDDEEMEQGVRCVAALVFDHNRLPAAAVSVSGTVTRLTPERIEQLGQRVRRCALVISHELGFLPDRAFTPHHGKEVNHV